MRSSTFKKGGFNQRERVSLIAEIMLQGASKIMEMSDKKDIPENTQDSKRHNRKINDADINVSKVHVNPR